MIDYTHIIAFFLILIAFIMYICLIFIWGEQVMCPPPIDLECPTVPDVNCKSCAWDCSENCEYMSCYEMAFTPEPFENMIISANGLFLKAPELKWVYNKEEASLFSIQADGSLTADTFNISNNRNRMFITETPEFGWFYSNGYLFQKNNYFFAILSFGQESGLYFYPSTIRSITCEKSQNITYVKSE